MLQRYSIGRESISPKMPGKLAFGKPSKASTRMCLRPISGFNTGTEVLAGEQVIQISRNVGQRERMIFAGNTPAQVSKKTIVNHREAMVIHKVMPSEPLRSKERPKDVFEHFHTGAKTLQNCGCRRGATTALPLEHPSFEFLLRFHGRQIGESQEVLALEVRAFSP